MTILYSCYDLSQRPEGYMKNPTTVFRLFLSCLFILSFGQGRTYAGAAQPPTQLLRVAFARTEVTSSFIASIGYDDTEATLEVEMIRGAVYHYFGVPKRIYFDMLSAPSKGQYFNAYIKGHYPFQRVR